MSFSTHEVQGRFITAVVCLSGRIQYIFHSVTFHNNSSVIPTSNTCSSCFHIKRYHFPCLSISLTAPYNIGAVPLICSANNKSNPPMWAIFGPSLQSIHMATQVLGLPQKTCQGALCISALSRGKHDTIGDVGIQIEGVS